MSKNKSLSTAENGLIGNNKDNFVDVINNAWGRKFGLELKKKYGISRNTVWTPELSANYLNDVQDYMENSLGIEFKDFSADD